MTISSISAFAELLGCLQGRQRGRFGVARDWSALRFLAPSVVAHRHDSNLSAWFDASNASTLLPIATYQTPPSTRYAPGRVPGVRTQNPVTGITI